MIKVLHIMSTCSRNSGIAHVVMNYYKRIYKDVKFDFLLFKDVKDSFENDIVKLGGEVFYSDKPSLKAINDYYCSIQDFFKAKKGYYDIIHLHELYLNPIIMPIAKNNGVKYLIAHSHTNKLSSSFLGAIKNKLLYIPLNYNANYYLACSNAAGELAFGKRKFNNSANATIVYNAIEFEKYEFSDCNRVSIRRSLGLSDEDVVLGHIGRFSREKNQYFLLKLFEKISKINKNFRLIMIGEGPNKDRIKCLIKRKNLETKIIILDYSNDVGKYLSAFDLFLLPSKFEGLGNVLIEAQCNGLPCIVSNNVPKEAKINDNYCSLSLNIFNNSSWIKQIFKMHSNRVFDANNMFFVSRYNINTESINLLKLYKRIINGDNINE